MDAKKFGGKNGDFERNLQGGAEEGQIELWELSWIEVIGVLIGVFCNHSVC